jgi:small subunit ribosomal protein S19
MRSSWKSEVFINNNLLKTLVRKKYQVYLRTKSRSSTIIPTMIGRTIFVYNGKQYRALTINSVMVGTKLGEYIDTTKTGRSIHLTKKNLKKKKR